VRIVSIARSDVNPYPRAGRYTPSLFFGMTLEG
jgi:hypothetical protein